MEWNGKRELVKGLDFLIDTKATAKAWRFQFLPPEYGPICSSISDDILWSKGCLMRFAI